ncbi:hypothetical protein [Polyangium jinanense]|uniref:Outer membrane protein beta-barrel domain-containing protein n=1 Tax=Polyangium jinanense TaxID=2829994 RepID=A0A9X3X156_9BACT|nr:hypothetical protein [Polyangium jinanense]MDC3954205.1 hypothetical protein [Polyangium jinanense]MDC3981839.1 hypothetical protein [Polyangium jinanense]
MRRGVCLGKAGLLSLSCAALLLFSSAARADDDEDPRRLKPKYGLAGIGFHIEAGAGVYQVVGQGGLVPGIYPRAALELHLGPHFSIPVVARFQTAIDPNAGVPDFAQLSVAPGINFRLRELDWPIALVFGAAVRIGRFSASQKLVDADFQTTPDAGTEEALGFPLAPEATAKLEWWIAPLFVAKVSATYAPVFVNKQPIHNVEEALAIALVF